VLFRSPMPTNKGAALRAGVPRFYTGRPCQYGHLAPRYANSGNCVVCRGNKIDATKRKSEVIPEGSAASREEALGRGLDHYYSLVMCAMGHTRKRMVSNRRCPECPPLHPSLSPFHFRAFDPKSAEMAIERSRAKERGDRYFTVSWPCARLGHISKRYTNSTKCVQCYAGNYRRKRCM
jgi:hypothetical protein